MERLLVYLKPNVKYAVAELEKLLANINED